jgi:hypothetical protein
MYISITGLKTKGLFASIRFWFLTVPAFKAARNANGIILCESKSQNGYHHTLTVWKSKANMIEYISSPVHLKAKRAFPSIAVGKVIGYQCDAIPSWEQAIQAWNEKAKPV